MARILVTGGAGYIGSHTVVSLLAAGHEVVVVDNLCNSSEVAIDRVATISGRRPEFHRVDLLDRAGLDRVFAKAPIGAVIHFAGLKAVGESVQKPLHYWQVNVTGTLNLLQAMSAAGVKRLVFSSSATVYGDPASVPIREDFPRSATNPYGATKLTIEGILQDLAVSDPAWKLICLRYFNPAGAHLSGLIGEDPAGIPNNLMPYLLQVAGGRRERIDVFGGDYPTRDGTGVRDFIHVVDLAEGHLAALGHLGRMQGWAAFNLGTGRGSTVLEMIAALSQVVGRQLPYRIVDRRPGDVAESYSDPGLAERVLGWRATRTLADMCVDGWRWQTTNPTGFGAKAG